MRLCLLLTTVLLISGCSLINPKPEAPPAPTAQAQEINRAQSYGLTRLGEVSVSVIGSPDDAQRAVAARANQAGATYYQILLVDETIRPGRWYASAILFAPASPAQRASFPATH
ncbi:biofilm peroxide resistance protein BsmA [Candidatus Pantoea multigeneris]|uniref:Biofilm peroxide resistance protein BsmA n=1 Tax=Candidatus Pantoea multigeneris TaxID=2608357 RepID=A0ABX0R7S6_9GAMM|nr:biofilm peroxide resistance protein BsmA [Pantoea multigeneris]NIF21412.1 biofilm peroxide resistance protein BsmA [Pantoea multigeneris]